VIESSDDEEEVAEESDDSEADLQALLKSKQQE